MPKGGSERIIYSLSEEATKLPISLFSACKYHLQESVSRAGGAPFYQILVAVDGKGAVRFGGSEYPLFRGAAFYVAKDAPIEYINERGLVSAFVTAVGDGAQSLAMSYGIKDFLYSEPLLGERYKIEIEGIVEAYNSGESDGRISSLVYSLFSDFFEGDKRGADKSEEALFYIDRNFDKRMTLSELSTALSVSVSGLCHSFKERYGKTVVEYITEKRLLYAKKLLVTESAVSVKEIATLSGFDDASYFSRAYKKRYGHSPTEERNICKSY